ncbi:Protein BZZ1 [Rhodosporidiobolus nylandii]
MASYGASLPDSEALIASRCSSHLSLLPQFSSFLSQLCATQRDASQKLSTQVGQFRRHIAATAPERSGGAEQAGTLELALARALEQLDLRVRELGDCAEKMGREVADQAETVGGRLDGVRKKHHAHYQKLLSLRDSAYHSRDRSRSAYFSACDTLESARQKKASAKEGRDTDKAARAYDAAYEDMELAKAQYLLDLDAANVAKTRLYDFHLPAVQDDYQLLEASAVRQLTTLMERMVQLQRESGERVLQSVEQARASVTTVDVERDQAEWVGRLEPTILQAFEKPPDLVFEESPVWHDTDAFPLSPTSITYLQNVSHKAATRAAESQPEIEAKKREVQGLKGLRESYERQKGLGDTVAVIENLFSTSHPLSALDFSTSLHRAQVELIDATLGDEASTGLRPHEFKGHSFVTPKCNMAVHSKCELKVPAGCAARPGAGVVRTKSRKPAPSASSSDTSTPISPTPSSSGSSFVSVSTTTLPPPRRAAPPAGGGGGLPPMPSAQDPPGGGGEVVQERARMAYDYEAQSGFELTVSEGDPVVVLVPEDESGWVKVRVEGDGREGLVPGSYIELTSGGPASAESAGTAAGGSAGGGGKVVALYDYAPAAADELPLVEGEEAELTAVGMAAGEGWAEISKSGSIGVVPSSYIQLL